MDIEQHQAVSLVDQLRGAGKARPPIDVALAPALRIELDQVVGADVQALPPDVDVRVNKRHLQGVLQCEKRFVRSLAPEMRQTSAAMVKGRLLDYLLAPAFHGLGLGGHPTETALSVATSLDDVQLLDTWNSLSSDERTEIREFVDDVALRVMVLFPHMPAKAYLRLQDRVTVALAHGRVTFSARFDAVVGMPTREAAGTTIIDAKSGKRSQGDVIDAAWHALLETLRSGVAPFQSGNLYLQDGTCDLQVMSSDRIWQAALRAMDGTRRMVRLAAGEAPTPSPSGLCASCPVLHDCRVGQEHVSSVGADLSTLPELGDDLEDDDDF